MGDRNIRVHLDIKEGKVIGGKRLMFTQVPRYIEVTDDKIHRDR